MREFHPTSLADLRMPGMNGLDLLRQLAGQRSVPPVVLVSAHLNGSVEQAAHRRGVVACLKKPFADAALLATVHAALR